MRKMIGCFFLLIVSAAQSALATPSNQIWIPSPDVQPFVVGHIDIDNYFRAARNSAGGRDPNTLSLGITVGLLPFEKLQLEVGLDYLTLAQAPNDDHPWSGNAKLAVPEQSICTFSPALAVGIYNAAPQVSVASAPFVRAGQNIAYALIAKTIPISGFSLGRFSGGYYHGSERTLQPDKGGMLLSWDRTIREISEKLWVAVDYMGGNNINGALSIGLAWRFTRNISLLVGYDMYHRSSRSGEDTLVTQLDINF